MDSVGLEVVLITGCSQGGIGHALAKEFAANNCLVVATSRSLSSMRDLEQDDRFYLLELDVTSEESVQRAVANVIDKYGRVDVLVNNAGVQCIAPTAEVPLSAMQQVFDTNVYATGFICIAGPMRMIQAVVPHMASRRKGKIVNVGSTVVLVAFPWSGPYCASKAALHALTDTLRLEVKPLGIDVINVVPGAIQTNILHSAQSNYKSGWNLYKAFDPAMRRLASQGTVGTPVATFAKHTVAAILKKHPPAWFSSGTYSTIMAIASHLPCRIKDLLVRGYLKP
ncbi:unnamed protein product [Linum tenue]|uniref:Uncharacterized protein n=1 Tax=Linum tenue TaxID=586396 RepID=A0AAV0L362_9ROSI|nr:unnamed protein product [Linum tenue]